jgi:hypothetical protein
MIDGYRGKLRAARLHLLRDLLCVLIERYRARKFVSNGCRPISGTKRDKIKSSSDSEMNVWWWK